MNSCHLERAVSNNLQPLFHYYSCEKQILQGTQKHQETVQKSILQLHGRYISNSWAETDVWSSKENENA